MARAEVAVVTGRELMERHIRSFNAGVTTGDFEPMLARFAPDAVLSFEGVPGGPYVGVDEIREAYGQRPPDDTVRLLGIQENDERTVVAAFAWAKGGTGRMRIEHDRGAVTALTVAFDDA
jgi:steroid Delta-isomerase